MVVVNNLLISVMGYVVVYLLTRYVWLHVVILLVHYMQKGWSPLHAAVLHGKTDLVKMLIEAGIPVDVKDNVSMYCWITNMASQINAYT